MREDFLDSVYDQILKEYPIFECAYFDDINDTHFINGVSNIMVSWTLFYKILVTFLVILNLNY